jgi:hypothetical protein
MGLLLVLAAAGPREYSEDDIILTNRAPKTEKVFKAEPAHYKSYQVMHRFGTHAKWMERS